VATLTKTSFVNACKQTVWLTWQ